MPWQCGTYNVIGDCPFTSGVTAAASGYDDVTESEHTSLSSWSSVDEDTDYGNIGYGNFDYGNTDYDNIGYGNFDYANLSSASFLSFSFIASPLMQSSNSSSRSGQAIGHTETVVRLRHLQADTTSPASGNGSPAMDMKTIIELYAIGILVVFGLLGNIASVVVLRRYRERRDALFLLQALAVADGLYLTVAGVRYPLKYVLTPAGGGTVDRYVEMQPIVLPLLKTFQTATIWMMVLVTVDRYCCVCRPLDASRCFNWSSRRRYAVYVFLLAFIYNTPRYLDSCVVRWVSPCAGSDIGVAIELMVYRETFSRPLYFDIYVDGLYLMLLYIGPLCTLIFINVRLVQAIRKSRLCQNCITSHRGTSTSRTWSLSNELRPTHSASSSDKNATVVLIIIVVVFVVCETPELVLKVMTFTVRNFDLGLQYSSRFVQLNVASELLMVVNSSINFVIYVAFGRRFRQILRQTFRCRSLLALFRRSRGGAGVPTAVTHDLVPVVQMRQPMLGVAGAAANPRVVRRTPYQQQRLQYHHNCIHVQAACGVGNKMVGQRRSGGCSNLQHSTD